MSVVSSHESSQERIVELELIVTHLQRDLDSLNAVVLDQQKQLGVLKNILGRLDDRLTRLTLGEEKFDPVAEKPPHY